MRGDVFFIIRAMPCSWKYRDGAHKKLHSSLCVTAAHANEDVFCCALKNRFQLTVYSRRISVHLDSTHATQVNRFGVHKISTHSISRITSVYRQWQWAKNTFRIQSVEQRLVWAAARYVRYRLNLNNSIKMHSAVMYSFAICNGTPQPAILHFRRRFI